MEQLDEALSRLLNDPGAMSQVMSLAQSLGAGLPEQAEKIPSGGQALPNMSAVLRSDPRQTALLQAMGAYLSPKRREKLERAVQLVRLSGLLKTAMQQNDPDNGKVI